MGFGFRVFRKNVIGCYLLAWLIIIRSQTWVGLFVSCWYRIQFGLKICKTELDPGSKTSVCTRGESKPERPETPFRQKNRCRYGVPVRVSSTLICRLFVFVQLKFFCHVVINKTFCRRMSVPQKICEIRCGAKGWDESQWGFSFNGVENGLLLRMIYHTEHLKPISDCGRTVFLFACEQQFKPNLQGSQVI